MLHQNKAAGLSFYGTGNIGDDIQSIAACRLIGEVDTFFDRDRLNEVVAPDGTTYWMILNSWFLSRPEAWPPSRQIHPLLVSFHLSATPVYGTNFLPREIVCSDALVDYLNFYGPIGARDQNTCDFLRSRGVDAYFSGCLTLTLTPREVEKNLDLVVLVDVNPTVEAHVRSRLKNKEIKVVTHTWHENDRKKRFARAEEYLNLFCSASLVVTSRLHCAMPCTGMDVPVILLEDYKDIRFSGLSEFCQTFTTAAFNDGACDHMLDCPPHSLNKHHGYASALRARVKSFIEARVTDVKPASFILSDRQLQQYQNEMQRRYSDIIVEMARRLDKMQGIENY